MNRFLVVAALATVSLGGATGCSTSQAAAPFHASDDFRLNLRLYGRVAYTCDEARGGAPVCHAAPAPAPSVSAAPATNGVTIGSPSIAPTVDGTRYARASFGPQP